MGENVRRAKFTLHSLARPSVILIHDDAERKPATMNHETRASDFQLSHCSRLRPAERNENFKFPDVKTQDAFFIYSSPLRLEKSHSVWVFLFSPWYLWVAEIRFQLASRDSVVVTRSPCTNTREHQPKECFLFQRRGGKANFREFMAEKSRASFPSFGWFTALSVRVNHEEAGKTNNRK